MGSRIDLSPITLGRVVLTSPVILAPMSGVTDLPFRRLVRRFGRSLVVSEMIASWAMIRENRNTMRMAALDGDGINAIQLAGCDACAMAEAARIAVGQGADLIDINFGCPVKKVALGQQAGSALMRDEVAAARILEATVRAVAVPVTLKMRTGWDHANRNAPSLARIAEAVGIRMVTVHGRTRQQFYEGRADWSFVRRVKDEVRIPVVVNGDVTGVDEARDALAASGADGVMVGRGSYGRPWILARIEAGLSGDAPSAEPTLQEEKDIIFEHYEAMLSHYGNEPGLRLARKHVGWYSQGLPHSAEFRAGFNRIVEATAARGAIEAFYVRLIDSGFVRPRSPSDAASPPSGQAASERTAPDHAAPDRPPSDRPAWAA